MTAAQQPKCETLTMPAVSVGRLFDAPESIDYFFRFFASEAMQNIATDDKKGYVPIYNGVQSMKDNSMFYYVPVVEGYGPIGMVYGSMVSNHLASVHWGIDVLVGKTSKERKHIRAEVIDVVIGRIFSDLGVNAIMGLVPVLNRASYAGAYQAGFRPQGKIEKYYLKKGKLQDVHIMILNKEGV